MSRLPAELRDAVWRHLYEHADRIDWENLSAQDKSQQYDRWLDDPEIGGVLARFMNRDRSRVYIKDSPMKEYARALAGEGPGAKFTTNRQASPEAIVRAALGGDWAVARGSVGIKPMHCWARNGDQGRYVCWAKNDGLGDLIWAALNVIADNENADPLLVIRESAANPTPAAVRDRQRRIAERCDLRLRYVHPKVAGERASRSG
ncbi:MAG: hypothetical protein ACRDM7_22525 [Thermoleophilaceae bacterium]